MATELPKQYDPKQAQQRWLDFWEQRGYSHGRPDPDRKPYAIVIPPPNVTGALHMGHALNNTLQDVLIRWRRMQGYNALYMPGTDHAGIATQAVVERRLKEEEGKTRHDLGREALVERIWKWKETYEKRILGQLKQLGCSCDWVRTRFTLDPICAKAVRQTFFKMFRDGLIFRGKRLVNWDTHLQTSVADDETFNETVKGGFWTFRYPIDETSESIRFSTTRPETMLGDTAVCVHPSDERYKHLIGKNAVIPLNGRKIPIIADGLLADPTLGTGCVKVTPAHDKNDYACGLRNNLPMINILNPDGTINENGGKYAGMDRYKARDAVVAEMEQLGFFEGREDREIMLPFSDRSKTPIEPYLSDQWFVRMGDREDGSAGLARMAMEAVESGKVKFFPPRYANTYLDWLSEREIGALADSSGGDTGIPVWSKTFALGNDPWVATRREIHKLAARFTDDINVITHGSMKTTPVLEPDDSFAVGVIDIDGKKVNGLCYSFNDNIERNERILSVCVNADFPDVEKTLDDAGFSQSEDVLDTWFSSALWPHSTLGWPEMTPELAYYYPTSTLVTSRDIITLWVARMVLTGLYNLGKVPFHHVYIHPKMLDGFGETMSKSKGNGIDPLDIIDRYGTDALRYGMVNLATETQDSRMPVSNVCPHCAALVPVKQEHMYLRTKKITCPSCKKPFRPGGPWPADDPELSTAKQASEKFEIGRNFANKLWNAARFLLLNLEGYTPQAIKLEELPIEDRWILSRLASTTAEVTAALEGYHFSDVARGIYDFTWTEFCDWYVEMSKGRLKDDKTRPLAQRVLAGVLDTILRLAHPVMPFVSESLWQALNEAAFERGLPSPEPSTESVMVAAWPELPAAWRDASMEQRFGRMQELVRAVREVRNRYMVDPKTPLDVFVRTSPAIAADFAQLKPFILLLGGVGQFQAGPDVTKPPQAASHVQPEFETYVSLQGLIDVAAETKRLEKQIAEKRKHLAGVEAKLGNAAFVDKAPPEVVQQQRDLVADVKNQIQIMEANLQELLQG